MNISFIYLDVSDRSKILKKITWPPIVPSYSFSCLLAVSSWCLTTPWCFTATLMASSSSSRCSWTSRATSSSCKGQGQWKIQGAGWKDLYLLRRFLNVSLVHMFYWRQTWHFMQRLLILWSFSNCGWTEGKNWILLIAGVGWRVGAGGGWPRWVWAADPATLLAPGWWWWWWW